MLSRRALLGSAAAAGLVAGCSLVGTSPKRMARGDRVMGDLKHRIVETNGIRMHIAEQGSGPLVLLCHGFPESWYSWRHQLPALAAAGYHAGAPDMRGYGQTDRPESIDKYTQLHMVGDMVGLLDALGESTCVIVGHDWGAPVAWNATLMRPDRFRAVAAFSVPYGPRGDVMPAKALQQFAGENFMYILYFQEPGIAEAELERDVRKTIRSMLYSGSANGAAQRRGLPPRCERWQVLRYVDRSGRGASMADGEGSRLLQRRVQPDWFWRWAELVPESRPHVGIDGRLSRGASHCSGIVHCGRGRSGYRDAQTCVREFIQERSKSHEACAPAGLRSLDPTGAAR